jgi:hypothetical protein
VLGFYSGRWPAHEKRLVIRRNETVENRYRLCSGIRFRKRVPRRISIDNHNIAQVLSFVKLYGHNRVLSILDIHKKRLR